MSPFLYILMGIMALYILCDIIQKCSNKKPSKPDELTVSNLLASPFLYKILVNVLFVYRMYCKLWHT